MTTILVWHRSDLRTVDSPALAAAHEDGDRIAPAFVVDPRYYGADGLACDARLQFLQECLEDLRDQYRDLGSDLALLDGDPRRRLRALLDSGAVDAVYYNRHPTARHGRRVAETVRSWAETTAVAADGLRYPDSRHHDGTVAVDTREGWDDHCEAYFESDPVPRPEALSANPVDSDVTLDAVADRFADPDKRDLPRGGTVAANARLEGFCDRIGSYPSVVSPPAAAQDRSSRLSADLAFGTLSPRQVYRRVQQCPDGRGRSMYVSRLYWNRHYHQKLADWPGWTDRAVNPVFRGLFREEHDPELDEAWQTGGTGFPMVDAAMRALTETGYINFRMRAMVAAVYVYVLKQWWKRGADFMYAHLLDADAAINYTQWQSQCNLTGVHPVRVYDPAKQQREYDPDGEFVREYVPELAPLPDEHLAEPAQAPVHVQRECGVDIGEDYPYPVVDYDHEADRAREIYADLADRAREALSDPRLRRRCSFSNRGRDRTDGDDGHGTRGQATLSDF
ncbi:FAD-binding domain-containing protein [Haloarcula halophila]|uniref:FAD-binding domain-containing protein n=1 Tax=Haloarcula TaxID=2237 RepID=UPI0023E406ED|nr:FAD-binding domain-containing protein [Halomicroarcula sp. DFY41]